MFVWFLKDERECYYGHRTWLQSNLTVEEYSEAIQKFSKATKTKERINDAFKIIKIAPHGTIKKNLFLLESKKYCVLTERENLIHFACKKRF